jgi:hypothetical protein
MATKQKPFMEALFFCKQILGESMLFEEGFGFLILFYKKGIITKILKFPAAFGFGNLFLYLLFFQFGEHFMSL